MLAYLESCKKELDQIQYSSDILARLEKKQAVTLKEAQMLGLSASPTFADIRNWTSSIPVASMPYSAALGENST